MMAYHFHNWDKLYENNKSRDVETLSYHLQPNKLVGEGLGLTLSQPDGLELLGTLSLLKAVASLSERKWRGWLVRSGSPLDAARIAALLRVSQQKIQRALDWFSTLPMDWLPLTEWPPNDQKPAAGHLAGTSRAPNGQVKDTISPGLTDLGLTDDSRERKKETRKVEASPEEQAKNQSRQWRATKGRIEELESIPDDDRTPGQEIDLKKMRALIRAIQKKQAAGDFTPVYEK